MPSLPSFIALLSTAALALTPMATADIGLQHAQARGLTVGAISGGPRHATASARSRGHRQATARPRHATARHRPPTAPSGHALKMIWGPLSMPDGSSAFPTYHRLGVQVLELQLSWASVAFERPADPGNPSDPAYVWPATMDRAVSEASRYGIALAVMVKETPAWANGGQKPSWAPDDPGDYAAFLQAASHRYPSIRDWMIWGEVTRAGNFNPMPPESPVGPQHYAVLLDAAYGALKAVNPANVVIGGMTYTVGLVSPSNYLRWLRLPDGSPPRMDLYGDNPYSTRYPKLSETPYSPIVRDINDIDTLHRELQGVYAGHGPTPGLWLSEFSISDAPSRAFDYYVSEPTQARWLTAAFELANSVPYVAGLGWYDLMDEPTTTPERLTEGLLNAAGHPKPAFYAYARAR